MTTEPGSDLTFEEFTNIVARELGLDEQKVVPEASFFSDLRVDSIRMVDMLLRLEELGINIPLEDAWEIETVEDAFRVMKGSHTRTED